MHCPDALDYVFALFSFKCFVSQFCEMKINKNRRLLFILGHQFHDTQAHLRELSIKITFSTMLLNWIFNKCVWENFVFFFVSTLNFPLCKPCLKTTINFSTIIWQTVISQDKYNWLVEWFNETCCISRWNTSNLTYLIRSLYRACRFFFSLECVNKIFASERTLARKCAL